MLVACKKWEHVLSGKLVLVRSDNKTAIHYVNYGACRIPSLTRLGLRIKDWELQSKATLVAVHITGTANVVADGLSRFMWDRARRDPWKDRELRPRFWRQVVETVGRFDVDAMASDDGANAKCPRFFCPSRPPFEEDLSQGNWRWFPPPHMFAGAPSFLRSRWRENRNIRFAVLVPHDVTKPWYNKLACWSPVLRFQEGTKLFSTPPGHSAQAGPQRDGQINLPWLVYSSTPLVRPRGDVHP